MEALRHEFADASSRHERRRAEIQAHLPSIFRLTAKDVYEILKEMEEKKQLEQTQRRVRMR
jgi:hypothetical protein